MKNLIQAAVVILFAASAAQAQQAVQWRVQDGGNGHWYEGRRLSTTSPVSWGSARIAALSSGGDLVSLNTPQESAWVFANIASTPSLWSLSCGPWIGAAQLPGSLEPSAGWTWVDSTRLYPSFPWTPAHQPDNATYCGGSEDYACYWYGEGTPQPANRFADLVESGYCIARPKGDWVASAVIEWSADCNNDGIVDYGQCREGSLPDFNGNNIPDCCEAGAPCVVGNYPLQWRVEDGGNGHWYTLVRGPSSINWDAARSAAVDAGGYLATPTSAPENRLLFDLTGGYATWTNAYGPWLGGFRDPSGWTWRWVTDEPWGWTNWCPSEPNNDSCSNAPENVLQLGCGSARWNDFPGVPTGCDIDANGLAVWGYFIEWSADCNNDGIVDKGQILRGQLQDANADGVPDVCQQPTCRDADFFPDRNINGVDLGVLLSQWGPPTQYTVADLNRDGAVDGIDLGLFLSFWGPCPY